MKKARPIRWLLALIALLLAANIPFVVWRAERTAQGRPFCIQLPYPPETPSYRPATSFLDLSVMRMHSSQKSSGGSQDYHPGFHAVLIVEHQGGMEWFNWSYRRMSFVPISDSARELMFLRSPSCEPSAGFTRELGYRLSPPDSNAQSNLRKGT